MAKGSFIIIIECAYICTVNEEFISSDYLCSNYVNYQSIYFHEMK